MSLSTSCRRCIFATFEGDEQSGCRAGRLDTFRLHRVPLEMVETDGVKHYHLPGLCAWCHHESSPLAQTTDVAEQLRLASDMAKFVWHAIVVMGPEDSVHDVVDTVQSLARQTYVPQVCHVVATHPDENNRTLPAVLGKCLDAAGSMAWNVRFMVERGPDGDPQGRGAAVDACVVDLRPAECRYYLVADAGTVVWPSLGESLRAALMDALDRFLVLLPVTEDVLGDDGNVTRSRTIGPVVQVAAHRSVGGNAEAEHDTADGEVVRCDRVEEKLMLLGKDLGQSYLIRRMLDVCPLPEDESCDHAY